MMNVWEFDEERLVLVHKIKDGGVREVDLEKCNSNAAILDWIVQIKNKVWADDKVLADLVRKIDELLYLQGNLCGGALSGTHAEIDVVETIKKVKEM